MSAPRIARGGRGRRRTLAAAGLVVSVAGALAAVALLSSTAGAAVAAAPAGIDRVVSLSGAIDSSCGSGITAGTPVYTTVSAAVAAATAGQQIYVCAGNYTANVSVTANDIDILGPNWNDPTGASDPATITAANAAQPVINFGTASTSDNGVRGLRLVGGTYGVRAQATSGAGWDDANTEGIRNNVITGSTVAGVQTNGLDSGLIAGNRITPASGANGIDTIDAVGALNIQSNTITLSGSGIGITTQISTTPGAEQCCQDIGGTTPALGNTITGGATGILLKGTPTGLWVDTGNISNNTLTGQSANGIRTEGVVGSIDIADNHIASSGASGILVAGPTATTGNDTEGVRINRNTITDAGRDGVEATGFIYNLTVGSSAANANTITDPARHGVNVTGSVITAGAQGTRNFSIDVVYVEFNHIDGAGADGVHLENIDIVYPWSNVITGSGDEGIESVHVDWFEGDRNDISGSAGDGVHLSDTFQGYVYDNEIHDNTGDGVELTANTGGVVVTLNGVHRNASGVRVTSPTVGAANVIYTNELAQNTGYACEDQSSGTIANPPASGTQGNDWTTDNTGASLQSPDGICGAKLTVTGPIKDGVVGTPYTSTAPTVTAPAGGTLTFFSSGLPAGLTMSSSTGVISGTPTVAIANLPVTIWVYHSGGLWGQFTDPITIFPKVTATGTLPDGTVGQPYASSAPTATGGNGAPYTWSTASTLPTGLSLNPSTGVISDTPAPGSAGTYTVTLKATDTAADMASGQPNSGTFTDTFTIAAPPALVVSGTFGSAAEGVAFASPAPTATGGTGPSTWSTSSPLPTGLSLNPSTGVISGTAAIGTAGTYPISLTATDSLGTAGTFTADLTVLPHDPEVPIVNPIIGGVLLALLAAGALLRLGPRREPETAT